MSENRADSRVEIINADSKAVPVKLIIKPDAEPLNVSWSNQLRVFTIEAKRKYRYKFDTDTSQTNMDALGDANWEAIGVIERDRETGILYKMTL